MNGQSSSTRIPVLRESRHRSTSRQDRGLSLMEKQMDQEVEKVLQEWDENIQTTSLQIRPLRQSASPSRSPHRLSNKSPHPQVSFSPTITSSQSLTPDSPLLEGERKRTSMLGRRFFVSTDSLKSDSGLDSGHLDTTSVSDGVFDTSVDSIDEDCKSPLFFPCPETGRKMFRMQFDVQGFDADNIKVKVSGRKLVVFAVHKENDSGRKSTTEFCRKLKMPEGADTNKLQSVLTDGILTIEAPMLQRASSTINLNTVEMPKAATGAALNVPQISESENGKILNLLVEIGPLFRSDDIVVKVKGNNKLLISAQREENNVHNKMTASLSREFDLPEKVQPKTLVAGLTHDGVLNITASVSAQSPHDIQPFHVKTEIGENGT